jgi:hypothetical protein
MITDLLEKVNQLPLDKQQEVEDFIDFLVSKYRVEIRTTEQSISEFRKQNMAKGQLWVDDDFTEPPGDF